MYGGHQHLGRSLPAQHLLCGACLSRATSPEPTSALSGGWGLLLLTTAFPTCWGHATGLSGPVSELLLLLLGCEGPVYASGLPGLTKSDTLLRKQGPPHHERHS